jgi:hypothetical protein
MEIYPPDIPIPLVQILPQLDHVEVLIIEPILQHQVAIFVMQEHQPQ